MRFRDWFKLHLDSSCVSVFPLGQFGFHKTKFREIDIGEM